jgi:hypothetical protein
MPVLFAVAVVPVLVHAQQPLQRSQPVAEPSLIEIPLRFPLEGLFELAEARMPRQAGHWRDWRKSYGVKTKYRAWRGPLAFSMQGETLIVQAHVRYWIKARKDLLGALKMSSSCGVDEPPRQAIIGVMIRLGWDPDWTLRPEFRVIPTRFLDRCEMTIADIDVTPLIGREFREQLENRMREALAVLQPDLHALRRQAQHSWQLLQEPVELAHGHWLLFNPQAVALSPLYGYGDSMAAHLALVMRPVVENGARPARQLRPLPPLLGFYPRAAGLNLHVSVDLDYAGLNAAINARLAGESFEVGGQGVDVETLRLSGAGNRIRVAATLTGETAGELGIEADMVFDAQAQALQLQNLSYTYTSADPLIETQVRLFHNAIRKALEGAANQRLQQGVEQWRTRLATLLGRILPDDVQLDMASLRLSQVHFDFTEQGIGVDALATGYVSVALR